MTTYVLPKCNDRHARHSPDLHHKETTTHVQKKLLRPFHPQPRKDVLTLQTLEEELFSKMSQRHRSFKSVSLNEVLLRWGGLLREDTGGWQSCRDCFPVFSLGSFVCFLAPCFHFQSNVSIYRNFCIYQYFHTGQILSQCTFPSLGRNVSMKEKY